MAQVSKIDDKIKYDQNGDLLPYKERELRNKKGVLEYLVFDFICPYCKKKFSVFWLEDGYRHFKGYKKCRNCEKRTHYNCNAWHFDGEVKKS